MSRRIIVLGAALVVLAAAAFFIYTNVMRADAAAVPSLTVPVTRGNLVATVSSAGPVAARAQVLLTFGTGGIVKQVYVTLGDSVKRGQVLAELEATELLLSLASAQASLNQQQARFEQTKAGAGGAELAAQRAAVESGQANYDAAVKKAGLNDAQLVVARASLEKAALALQKAQSDYDTAVSQGKTDLTAVSAALQQAQIDYNSAQANFQLQVANINDSGVRSSASALASAKANLLKLQSSPTPQDLQIAQAQLEQARIAVQQAQYRLRSAQIIAPFDGVVSQVNIEGFSTVGANTQAIQVSDLGRLQLTVNMPEVDIGKVKVGQDVIVTFDALPDRPQFDGKVEQIALVAVTQQGVVSYPVVITLTNPDLAVVKTGMTANVSIIVDRRDNVLLVPNRAIRTQGRQRVVQVQTAVGPVQSPVTIGLQNESQSEVVSGLKEGDVLVIQTTTQNVRVGGGGFGAGPGNPVFIPR